MKSPATPLCALLLVLLALFLVVPAHAENAFVQLVAGFIFDPAEVTINVGESVTWVNTSGDVHSTSNGTGFEDPEWGTLWDYWFFNGPDETFVRTFDTPGVYPYFCVPHIGLGMTGSVTVQAPSSVEASTWGAVKGLFR